jgi:hypothetical protein
MATQKMSGGAMMGLAIHYRNHYTDISIFSILDSLVCSNLNVFNRHFYLVHTINSIFYKVKTKANKKKQIF